MKSMTKAQRRRLTDTAPALYNLAQALTEPCPEDLNVWDWLDDLQAYARRLVDDIDGGLVLKSD